jgi:hypothetical protein
MPAILKTWDEARVMVRLSKSSAAFLRFGHSDAIKRIDCSATGMPTRKPFCKAKRPVVIEPQGVINVFYYNRFRSWIREELSRLAEVLQLQLRV